MKLIFLDIDGVLNGHQYMKAAQSTTICRPCVQQFNRVLKATGAKVVLSSAWRYMLTGKAMNLLGFEYMLRTHGVARLSIIGNTGTDETCPACTHIHRGRQVPDFAANGYRTCVKCRLPITRAAQVTRWLMDHLHKTTPYVVIDDLDLGFSETGHPFVKTNGRKGLTRAKADEAISLLSLPSPSARPSDPVELREGGQQA